MRRLSLELSEAAYGWIIGMVAIVQSNLPGEVVTIQEHHGDGIGTPKVVYHAIGGPEVMAAIGANRFDALIYARLLETPCTTIQLRQAMPSSNHKAIQSALHRLRTSGFVESRPIAD